MHEENRTHTQSAVVVRVEISLRFGSHSFNETHSVYIERAPSIHHTDDIFCDSVSLAPTLSISSFVRLVFVGTMCRLHLYCLCCFGVHIHVNFQRFSFDDFDDLCARSVCSCCCFTLYDSQLRFSSSTKSLLSIFLLVSQFRLFSLVFSVHTKLVFALTLSYLLVHFSFSFDACIFWQCMNEHIHYPTLICRLTFCRCFHKSVLTSFLWYFMYSLAFRLTLVRISLNLDCEFNDRDYLTEKFGGKFDSTPKLFFLFSFIAIVFWSFFFHSKKFNINCGYSLSNSAWTVTIHSEICAKISIRLFVENYLKLTRDLNVLRVFTLLAHVDALQYPIFHHFLTAIDWYFGAVDRNDVDANEASRHRRRKSNNILSSN